MVGSYKMVEIIGLSRGDGWGKRKHRRTGLEITSRHLYAFDALACLLFSHSVGRVMARLCQSSRFFGAVAGLGAAGLARAGKNQVTLIHDLRRLTAVSISLFSWFLAALAVCDSGRAPFNWWRWRESNPRASICVHRIAHACAGSGRTSTIAELAASIAGSCCRRNAK